MPNDIRDLMKNRQERQKELSKDHRKRFKNKLQQLHTQKKKRYIGLKMAATIVLLMSIGYFSVQKNTPVQTEEIPTFKITSLGSISPEMQKVEDYYLTAINYEIASLEVTPENNIMLDNYLDKIGKLDADYKRLNNQLSEKGINEKIINSLITNLQLRLQILLQLKDQLTEIKTAKAIKNEDDTI